MNLPHLPIARELLAAELERLEHDHFADDPLSPCQGCQRAYAVSAELRETSANCANCGAAMNAMFRAHHHAENGQDVTR